MIKEALEQQPLIISKLSLVMTENCNLNCSYCYARLSNRWYQNKTMSRDIANIIINKIIIPSKMIDMIQFFGGEPTLNIDVIKYIATEIDRLYAEKVISMKPRLGIVSNGCFQNKEKVLDIIKTYHIEPTISIDGPKTIQDQLRYSKRNISCYEEVRDTIEKLQGMEIEVNIETVFTAKHIDAGYSIIDTMKFAQELGVKKLIFQSAYPPADDDLNPLSEPYFDQFLQYYMQAVDWWFSEFIQNNQLFDIYFKDLLKIMLYESPASTLSGCSAGINSFSIGPEGSVYPCQLLYGKSNLKMGNISDENFVFHSSLIPQIHCEFEECSQCFARHWCIPCPALNDFFGNLAHPPKQECEIRRAVILRIAQWATSKLDLPKNEHTERLMTEICKL